ncbi:hypothetical protein [Streptomyces microflavus]
MRRPAPVGPQPPEAVERSRPELLELLQLSGPLELSEPPEAVE